MRESGSLERKLKIFFDNPAVKRKLLGIVYLIAFGFFAGILSVIVSMGVSVYRLPFLAKEFAVYTVVSFTANILLNPVCGLILLFSRRVGRVREHVLLWSTAALIAADLYEITMYLFLENGLPMTMLILFYHVYGYFVLDSLLEQQQADSCEVADCDAA